jgi:hypothetical protein
MGGTVEGHVLGEVRQALLVFVFEDGACLDHQPQLQLSSPGGRFSGCSKSGHWQFANFNLRSHRDFVTELQIVGKRRESAGQKHSAAQGTQVNQLRLRMLGILENSYHTLIFLI